MLIPQVTTTTIKLFDGHSVFTEDQRDFFDARFKREFTISFVFSN